MNIVTDLDALETCDTAVMTVKAANEEPILIRDGESTRPATITFWAPGSEAYVAAETKRTNRNLRRQKQKAELTADILRMDQVDFLVDVTKEFDLPPYRAAGGATGNDLLRQIYASRKLDIGDQATLFLSDRAHFTKDSATS